MRMSRRFTVMLLIVTMTATVATGVAVAGKGGRGGTDARISFDPAQVVEGSAYVVEGSGFGANRWVSVGARYADTTWWASGWTDERGHFSFTFTATSSGNVLHDAYQQGNSGRFRLKASATLTVAAAP